MIDKGIVMIDITSGDACLMWLVLGGYFPLIMMLIVHCVQFLVKNMLNQHVVHEVLHSHTYDDN